MKPLAKPRRVGLLRGFFSVFRGAGFLLLSPRSWPYALVPGLMLSLLATLGIWLSLAVVWPSVSPAPDSHWLTLLATSAAGWLVTTAAILLSLLLAVALAPPLSAPALEHIVGQREASLGAPPRAPLGFWREVGCGLKAQLVAACFAGPLLLTLWLLGLLIPGATFVTTPLAFLVTALGLAWNLFDYPLTLRGVSMRERLRFTWRHRTATLGFGLSFALLFWVPCFGVLLLPVGVAAATELLWSLLEGDPLGATLGLPADQAASTNTPQPPPTAPTDAPLQADPAPASEQAPGVLGVGQGDA